MRLLFLGLVIYIVLVALCGCCYYVQMPKTQQEFKQEIATQEAIDKI